MEDTDHSYLHEDLKEAGRALERFRVLPVSDEADVNERRKQAMDDIKERIKEIKEELGDTES